MLTSSRADKAHPRAFARLSSMFRQPVAFVMSFVLLLFAPQIVQAQVSDSEAAVLVEPVISNFATVSSTKILRGAAPSDQGIERLSRQGVKTVVDLRLNGESSDHEQVLVDRLGMKYVHIPIGLHQPTVTQIVTFLRVVNDQSNQPVFVHCRFGADRTGMLIGIYRILVQHWSYGRVYSEMREHHFKPWLAGMKKTVELVAMSDVAQQSLRRLMTIPDEKSALAAAMAMSSLREPTSLR